MDNEKIGLFISILRKEKNMTQKALADKLFVSDKAVSKWERGLSMPDIGLIEKLANLLDVSVSEILKGEKINKIDKKSSDDIVKVSIPFFQKIYFKAKINKYVKMVLIGVLIFIPSYILLMWIGEKNYGTLSWRVFDAEYNIKLPNFGKVIAKNNSKQFLRALKEYDYETIGNMLQPSEGRYYFPDQEYPSFKEMINAVKKLEKSGVKLVRYKSDYCYHDSRNYSCVFILTYEYKSIKYKVSTQVNNYRDTVSLNANTTGNYGEVLQFNESTFKNYIENKDEFREFFAIYSKFADILYSY